MVGINNNRVWVYVCAFIVGVMGVCEREREREHARPAHERDRVRVMETQTDRDRQAHTQADKQIDTHYAHTLTYTHTY